MQTPPIDAQVTGNTHARLRRDDGVTMILVALLTVPIIIMAAIAVDLGAGYAKGRLTQNGADAAAMAGARVLVRVRQGLDSSGLVGSETLVSKAAIDTALQNGATPGGTTCNVIQNNSAQTVIGPCNVPANLTNVLASGVSVSVNSSAKTVFAPVIGKTSLPVTRVAAATAQPIKTGGSAPFAVCGAGQVNVLNSSGAGTGNLNGTITNPLTGTTYAAGDPLPSPLMSNYVNIPASGTSWPAGTWNGAGPTTGGTFNPMPYDLPLLNGPGFSPSGLANPNVDAIFVGTYKTVTYTAAQAVNEAVVAYPSANFKINPAAIGLTYYIHAPAGNNAADGFSGCSRGSASWKGTTQMDSTLMYTLPGVVYGDTGVSAGQTQDNVQSEPGCGNLDSNCVIILPLCPGSNGDTGSHFNLYCTHWGAFQLMDYTSNEHWFKFIGGAQVTTGVGGGLGGFDPTSVYAVRLVK